MNKTAIEFLIDIGGFSDENQLINNIGEYINIETLTTCMDSYAEFYHQSKLREDKSDFVTMDMNDLERWNVDFA